ncbi:DUF6421 family protein, partial [Streptomyces sp. NPDC058953]|uniref:DUF6421 family protein n=1 Tax=Streptomyces sp. NPDC058953 TaxID=3346676 RepID=UPI0036ACF7D8
MTEILVQDAAVTAISTADRVVDHPAWKRLKSAVEAIRPWQSEDGSIDFDAEGAPARAEAEAAVERVAEAVGELSPLLPHGADYQRAHV